jgi:hypothetical protein
METPQRTRTPRAPRTPATVVRGEVSYAAVVGGSVRKYCFDLEEIPSGDVEHATAAVVGHVQRVIADAERTRPVARFTVGKTYAKRATSVPEADFDPTVRAHLAIGPVVDRWGKLYEPAGYDGLVILCMVQARHAPSRFLANGFTVQDYALLLEHGAIRHFAAVECDARLGNTSFAAGKAESSGAPAYCVYLAFQFEKRTENVSASAFNMAELETSLVGVLLDESHHAESQPSLAELRASLLDALDELDDATRDLSAEPPGACKIE